MAVLYIPTSQLIEYHLSYRDLGRISPNRGPLQTSDPDWQISVFLLPHVLGIADLFQGSLPLGRCSKAFAKLDAPSKRPVLSFRSYRAPDPSKALDTATRHVSSWQRVHTRRDTFKQSPAE